MKISIVFFLLFFLVSCGKEATMVPAEKAKVVEAIVVQPQSLREDVKILGRVGSSDQAIVASQMNGELESILVQVGNKVQAGQVIAKINDAKSPSGIASRSAMASYEQAKKVYDATKMSLIKDLEAAKTALYQSELNRDTILENTRQQEATAKIQYQSAQSGQLSTSSTLESSRKSAELSVQTAQTALENFEKTTTETLTTLEDRRKGIYESLRISLEGNVPTLDSVFYLVDTTYGVSLQNATANDTFQANLSSKDEKYKKLTEEQYLKAIALYEEYAAKKDFSTATGSMQTFLLAQKLFQATSEMLSTAILGLNKSVEWVNFPKTQIDALSASFALKQSTFTTLSSSITSGINSVTDSNNSLNSTKTTSQTNRKTLEIALASAKQGLETLISGNSTSQNSVETSKKLAKIQFDTVTLTAELSRKAAEASYVTARANYESAIARRDATLANVESQIIAANNQRLSSEVTLKNLTITAPYAWIVLKRHVQRGATVNPGSPIITIATQQALIWTLEVPTDIALFLIPGTKTIIEQDGQSYTGSITFIGPSADESSWMHQVELQFAPLGIGTTIPQIGTLFDATLSVNAPEKTLIVPFVAVIPWSNETYRLMVIGKDSRAYSRMVQLWRKNKDSVEVISGLKAGERVIVRGALSVQEKELVVTELPKK